VFSSKASGIESCLGGNILSHPRTIPSQKIGGMTSSYPDVVCSFVHLPLLPCASEHFGDGGSFGHDVVGPHCGCTSSTLEQSTSWFSMSFDAGEVSG